MGKFVPTSSQPRGRAADNEDVRWLVLVVLVLSGCQMSTIDLNARAAAGPPDEPRFPIVETLTVDGDEVTDDDDVTGWCVHVELWTGSGWVKVLTADEAGGVTIGAETFCELGGHLRASTYPVPFSQLPRGWYTVCNMGQECAEPFEKT